MKRAWLATTILVVACGSRSSPETSGSGSATDRAPPPLAHTIEDGPSMSTTRKPYEAFRAHAAASLGVAPDTLDGGGPIDAATAASFPNRVGAAWPYDFHRRDRTDVSRRGWALADGTVITTEQNLGLLFVEAGVWTATPSLDAATLAGLLAWSYGMGNRVFPPEPERGLLPPRLTMQPDGTGALRFFLGTRQPGPGGAGGGPEPISEITVTLTADHRATLARVPFEPTR